MSEEEGDTTTLDDTFDALASHHRRRVLVSLLDHNPQSAQIKRDAAQEGNKGGESDRLQTAMYHNHLPKLEARGFISWGRNTNEIEKGSNFEQIRPLLELLDSHASELPGKWP